MNHTALKAIPITPRKEYKPALSMAERAAYQAAWRIVRDIRPDEFSGFGCPSRRRAALVDRIAEIVCQELRPQQV